jgi:hypothetical protein
MSKTPTLELCRRHLYDDVDKLKHLAENVRSRLLRIRSGYTLWNEFPRKKQKEIAQHIMQMYGVQKSVAYDDIRLIQDLLGSINRSSKDWHLYQFNMRINRAYEIAENKNDSDAMTKAMNVYGKYNQLDKDDPTEFPWDEIRPQNFEITSDPSVIGIKPIPNLKDKIAKLYAKYQEDLESVEDVTYEEMDIEPIQQYG